jgi:hypothetical protein
LEGGVFIPEMYKFSVKIMKIMVKSYRHRRHR